MAIIYHNLRDSNLTYKYDNLLFYFSSEFNLKRFSSKVINYVKEESFKINSKYRLCIYADELFLLDLYRKIEKRGFKVLYKGLDIQEFTHLNCTIDLENSI